MKSIAVVLLFALVAFVPACGECQGGWANYTNYVSEPTIESWIAEGKLNFSDGLNIYECDQLCQPGGVPDFRGCSEYERAGHYTGSAPPGVEHFAPEWAGGAGGRDGAFVFGEAYYSIKCTYFVRNTCGQLFPAR